MKKVILIRIGQVPNPAVTAALVPHMTGRPIAFPIPGAIVSVFDTPHSLEEVHESVKQTGAFFFLAELDKTQMHLPDEIMEVVSSTIGTPTQSTPAQPELSIDDVLDLIARNGIESLTPDQRRILNEGRA